MRVLYYYESGIPLKRNIPVYLSREGFEICNLTNIYDVDIALQDFQPKAILVHSESDALLLSRATTLPIVIVMDTPLNGYEMNEVFKNIKNPVFVRSYNDSLDTISNTVKLATTL